MRLRSVASKFSILAVWSLVAASALPAVATAAPTLRRQVNQPGDFVLLGNTSAFDCDASVPSPIVGSVPNPRTGCGPNLTDDGPDIFFRATDTAALGDLSVTVDQASSTARLVLPAGATVTYARVYWGSLLADGAAMADNTITLTRPGVSPLSVTADQTYFANLRYQGTADVTTFVQAQGAGAYRVSGIQSRDFRNLVETNSFVTWAMVVFYRLNTDPLRNLTLFDGFDEVKNGQPANATLSGFRVPNAGFDGKLGVIAYEGDFRLTGDSLLFNGQTLSDAQNPANNFFNSTRTSLGVPVSVVGDLPQMSGAPNTMNGIDLDVMDVRPQLSMGQTSATISARSVLDVFYLGAFVTSISTLNPDFTQSVKSARDVNGAPWAIGDVVEYTIVVRNTGSDTAVNAVLTDTLPTGVTYVPGSLQIVDGPNPGAKTDATGDDQGEYVAATRTVVVRLGTGASGTAGGQLARSAVTTVRFRVAINAGVTGNVANQAVIRAAGLNGTPTTDYLTDGDTNTPGQQPSVIVVDRCQRDADCPMATPRCNTVVSPKVCVQCRTRADCGGRTPVCNASGTCVACNPADASTCPDAARPACNITGPQAGACTECSSGNRALCTGQRPQCLTDLGQCGCSDVDGDSECGSTTSGLVCNGPAGLCVAGCSTAPGRNNCPANQVCSNTTGGLGTCIMGGCTSDAQCTTAPLRRCDTSAMPRVCVQCLSTADCGDTLVCELTARRCVECTPEDASRCTPAGAGAVCLGMGNCGCTRDGDCGDAASGRICDASTSRCIPGCRGRSGNGCPLGQRCSSTTTDPGQCQGCQSNADCSGRRPFCDPAQSVCVACIGDQAPSCTDATRPACQRSGNTAGACTECSATNTTRCTSERPVCAPEGACVGCIDNADCSGTTPFCDPMTRTCTGCRGNGPPSCPDPDRPICLSGGDCGCERDGDCGDETSGRVCDDQSRECRPGCRGQDGNGCPRGRTCSSTTNEIGECELRPTDGGPEGDGGSTGGECEGAPESNGRVCGEDGKGLCFDGACRRAEVSGAGCACDTQVGGGAQGFLWAAALLALALLRLRQRPRRRWVQRRSRRAQNLGIFLAIAALVAALQTGRDAHAGKAAIDIEQWKPNGDGRGLFSAESADAHNPGEWNLGLTLHWAKDPLILRVGDTRIADQVNHRFTGNVLFGIGVAKWLELNLALPVAFWNDQNQGLLGSSTAAGLGMLRFGAKFRLLREGLHGVGLSLYAGLGFPTGNTDAFLGQDQVVFAPALLVEKGFGPVRFLLNFGGVIRERATYLNLDVNNELYLRFGVGWRLHDKLELGGELLGSTQASSPFGTTPAGNPLELHFGARILPTDKLQVFVGGGPGMTYGYGSPRVRLFAGVMYGAHERDTDGDGVPDRRDRCPKERGPASNQGCPAEEKEPDTDGDGLFDSEDRCPTIPGPRANKGCPWPDTDGDGTLDKDDDCPTEPGPKENRGCPISDRDKDGVPDKEDKCPDVPGPKANRGCPWPDRDKDGVLDKDDACPDVPGPKDNLGCPYPDRDKDGVLDKDDKCPDVPGPKENEGCPWPDRDKDGVPDKDDACPSQPGPASNKGCPLKARVLIFKGEVKILDRVNFRTGSAVILRGSYKILDQVAAVLRDTPELKRILVQGHTDDVGRRASNMVLSRKRAAAVRAYLMRKGVAGERLESRGYGPDLPFVKLKRGMSAKQKRAARYQNRRVQFLIQERSDGGAP